MIQISEKYFIEPVSSHGARIFKVRHRIPVSAKGEVMHKRARTLIMAIMAGGMILALCASSPMPAYAQLGDGGEAQGEAEEERDAEAVRSQIEKYVMYLGARNWRVRLHAVESLLDIGTPEVVEPLIGALDDENPVVRGTSAEALGKVGAREALVPLIKRLDDGNAGVRHDAAEALGNIGSPEAADSLIESLKDENGRVRLAAIKALRTIGEYDNAEPFVEALEDSYDQVRRLAAAILDDIGYEPATERKRIYYLIAKGRWSDLIEIGAPAAEPLVSLMVKESPPLSGYIGAVLRRIGEPVADPLLAILKEPISNPQGFREAINILVEFEDERAIEPLIEIVKDPGRNFMGVNAACSALGEFGDPRAIEPLVELIKRINRASAPTTGAGSASFALAKIGEEAVEPLIDLLGEEYLDPRQIRYTIRALGEIGDPKAIEALARYIDHDDNQVRRDVVNALADIGDEHSLELIIQGMRYGRPRRALTSASLLTAFGEPALVMLIEALQDEDPQVRMEAARQLSGFEDERVVEPLIELLNDEDASVRRQAASSLCEIPDARALEPLINAMDDEVDFVRISAARALGLLDDQRAVEPLIGLLDEENLNLRSAGVVSLGRIGGERAADALVEVLRNRDEELRVRRSAARYLGAMEDGRAVDAMIEVLNPPGESTCSFTVTALVQTGDKRAVEPLMAIMMDEDEFPGIRSRAARAMAEIGDEKAIGALTEFVAKGAESERRYAIRALGHTGDERFVEIILPHLKRKDSTTRATAASAVESLGYVPETVDERVTFLIAKGGRASGDNWEELVEIGAPAVEPLIEMLKDGNNNIRSAAAETLGKIGDERAVEPLEALRDDENTFVRISGFEALMMIDPEGGFSY